MKWTQIDPSTQYRENVQNVFGLKTTDILAR